MSRRLRVAWVFDWFAYYAAGVLDSLAESTDLLVLTRSHGLELGQVGDAADAKRAMMPTDSEVVLLTKPQGDPRSIGEALRARRSLKRFRPDVIHIQDHFDWRLWLAATLLNVPKVITVHDVEPHPGWVDPRNRLQRRMERLVRRSAKVICVHGDSLVSLTKKQAWYRAQPVVSIPMGTHSHEAAVSPLPDCPTVLFFGRLEYYKGLDLFVAAVEKAADTVPDLRAIVAGQGDAAEEAQTLVTRPELFDWRIGFVEDGALPGLFAESSIVVLPYREASQSGVVPVAFANGRAVIATRVGGLVHVVEDGVNGLLVEPANPTALADAILAAFSELSTLGRLTAGAIATIETGAMSPQAISSAHLHAYRLAMNGGDVE